VALQLLLQATCTCSQPMSRLAGRHVSTGVQSCTLSVCSKGRWTKTILQMLNGKCYNIGQQKNWKILRRLCQTCTTCPHFDLPRFLSLCACGQIALQSLHRTCSCCGVIHDMVNPRGAWPTPLPVSLGQLGNATSLKHTMSDWVIISSSGQVSWKEQLGAQSSGVQSSQCYNIGQQMGCHVSPVHSGTRFGAKRQSNSNFLQSRLEGGALTA